MEPITQRVTHTYDVSPRPLLPLGCGYPVNIIYDPGRAFRPAEPRSARATAIYDMGPRPTVVMPTTQRVNIIYDTGPRSKAADADEPLVP